MGEGRWRSNLAWPLLASVALPSCAGSLADKVCTLVGCSSGAGIDATLDVTYADLRLASITVCRNDTCVSGILTPPTSQPMDHEGVNAVITSTSVQEHVTHATLSSDGSSWRIHLDWREGTTDTLKDGDTYRLTLTSTQGRSLGMLTGHASYHDFQPNGPDCDPTCRSAAVKL